MSLGSKLMTVCSIKSLQADRRASSRSHLESMDNSRVNTSSHKRVASAFCVLMEKKATVSIVKKFGHGFPGIGEIKLTFDGTELDIKRQ